MQSILRFCASLFLLLLHITARAQVSGCTDPAADNYNPSATHNDGSCLYGQTTVTAVEAAYLSDTIRETSGLLYWDGAFWTHNDDTDTTLYAIDTATGRILRRFNIAGAANIDWEDITQDDTYFYIGDFGNNSSGNRKDLVILRIPKAALSLGQSTITPDKIFFSYADQTNFNATGSNNTDFDCEALIAASDSLYLFSKQWISGKTKVYALPKVPGTYLASPRAEYNVDGLITGATYMPAQKLVALCGYKISGITFQPFVCLLYDFNGRNFLSGNKRKILVSPKYQQTEGIASIDGRQFFLSSERLEQGPIVIVPKLLRLDLGTYLAHWYSTLAVPRFGYAANPVSFYPNPARHSFAANITAKGSGTLEATIYNESGQLVSSQSYSLHTGLNKISFQNAGNYPPAAYLIRLQWEGRSAWGRILLN